MSKKGKGVMMFVDLKPDISERQAEIVMRIWQTSLQNNHIIAERYYSLKFFKCFLIFLNLLHIYRYK